nr:MotA/TolQ/ExbB proton channel family protein [Rhodopirellula sallentina]
MARRWVHVLVLAMVGWVVATSAFPSVTSPLPTAHAQGIAPSEEAGQNVEMIDAADIEDVMNEAPEIAIGDGGDAPSGIDLLSLFRRGGWFMAPIGLMSMLVVTLAVERSLSLRTSKVLPRGLMEELSDLSAHPDHFPPSTAWEVCHEYPSPAARVVMSMLMRTGQPLGEIERTGTETIQREADRYASPVRWLTLAAAATPLMGLLGTVWGMIVAFHESSTLTADRSRSEQLSEGIYTALVTTLAGLVVAIPAAIFAQYLENRITKLFHRIEELAFAVAPGMARFAGRSKLDNDGQLRPIEASPPPVGTGAPPKEPNHANGVATPPPVASPS